MRCIRREVHPVSKLPRWHEEARSAQSSSFLMEAAGLTAVAV